MILQQSCRMYSHVFAKHAQGEQPYRNICTLTTPPSGKNTPEAFLPDRARPHAYTSGNSEFRIRDRPLQEMRFASTLFVCRLSPLPNDCQKRGDDLRHWQVAPPAVQPRPQVCRTDPAVRSSTKWPAARRRQAAASSTARSSSLQSFDRRCYLRLHPVTFVTKTRIQTRPNENTY